MTMTHDDSGGTEMMTHKQEMSRQAQGSLLLDHRYEHPPQTHVHMQMQQHQQDQIQMQHQKHNQNQSQNHPYQHQLQQYNGSGSPPMQQQPIKMSLSRFSSADGAANLVFRLQDANPAQTSLAPWNSIYIPKQYRVPIPGQRQSSPGECDLALKIFPRLALPGAQGEPFCAQDLLSAPCERCKNKKRDIFQIAGLDPAVPSPQRLFFSTGEIRLVFKICCPPWHHTESDVSYVLTFELHHGKHVLLSETFRDACPGLFPEPIPAELVKTVQVVAPGGVRPIKRKSSPTYNGPESMETEAQNTLPRKRSTLMSLNSIVSSGPTPPATEEPVSPVEGQDASSPSAYQNDSEEQGSVDSGDSNKSSRSGSAKAEDISGSLSNSSSGTKPTRKRQEPLELSELGIGQRASANLHAAYVNGQLKERTKEGASLTGSDAPKKLFNKPKPQHSCPEPDCDKSFSRLFNLRSHMRTHSKARPFVCEDCNFAFSRRHDRDRHAKKHLSEKPYKCIVCDATFVRQDALVRHLRMDGVQNLCMAAMEQRSMQLGEAGDSYMLAAKQQAQQQTQDEQQLQEIKDANERKRKAIHQQKQLERQQHQQLRQQQQQLKQQQQPHHSGIADLLKQSAVIDVKPDHNLQPEFFDMTPTADKNLDANLLLKNLEPLAVHSPPSEMHEDGPTVHDSTLAFKNSKVENVSVESALLRSVSHQDQSPTENGRLMDAEGQNGVDTAKHSFGGAGGGGGGGGGHMPMSTPLVSTRPSRYEKHPQPHPHPQPGHPDYYHDDRYGGQHGSHGSHAHYPSAPPSRSHSRTHSQSQLQLQSSYPGGGGGGSEYHSPMYHPHASPAPLAYHPSSAAAKHGYREEQPHSYTYTSETMPPVRGMSPSHHRRASRPFEEPQQQQQHQQQNEFGESDFHGGAMNGHEGVFPGREREREGAGVGVGADPADKSIFDAAVGLLRIRSSQW